MRKARIITGEANSTEAGVQSVGSVGAVRSYGGQSFRGMRVEGTYTHQEVEMAKQTAHQEGIQVGMQQAEAQLVAPLRTAVENMENVLDELSRFRRELFHESEQEILDFIRLVSKRVLGRELKLDPEALKAVVTQALSLLEKQKRISIEFHPDDASMFQHAKPDFLERFKGIEDLEVHQDAQVPAGSAILKTRNVEMEVNFSSMVDHLLEQIQIAKIAAKEVNDEEDQV